jgi:hypothetical protein
MKCINHLATDAVAICPYCGRALCADCIQTPSAPRLACSSACATALDHEANAVQLLLAKSVQSARASSFYSYLCGGLSAAAAVAAWFMLPSPFLIDFTAGCALVFFAAGFWHGRGAKAPSPPSRGFRA